MRHVLIVSLCFAPLAIIFIIMKVLVWFEGIGSEVTYVRDESRRVHGPYLGNPHADVDAEEEDYGSRTDYQ